MKLENDINSSNEKMDRLLSQRKSIFSERVKGAVIGVAICISIILISGIVAARLGYMHIGNNSEIYVTDTSSDDTDGVGSQVEKKLNAIDSVLSQNFYFDNVDDETATNNIYKAYLDSYGDKYTVYYTPEEYSRLMESTSGTFYGIGAVCQKKQDDGSILLVDVYENEPGYKAGLRTGDCITKINGQDISDTELSAAVALIKGEKGTKVNLEVKRDDKTFSLDITRDEVNIKTVNCKMLDDKTGYIDISQFDKVTTEQFKDAIAELEAQGMEGLIIDIRANPGGVLKSVVDMLDYILPNGLIVYTEDKDGNRKEYNGSDGHELDIPIAVLVDGNSASASEIFAGAVQDYGKGEIIGTQTFGKGIVQTIQPLTDGSAIKYTISKYFTPKGQDIHGHGVTPDEVVELPKDATQDIQLNAAITYINEKL